MKHEIVTSEQWLLARKALLEKEKEFTRLREELAQARRALPWERVQGSYMFDGPGGEQTLAELFAGRSQLVVYHFMFKPEAEAGCNGCSFWADSFDHIGPHLAARDVTFLAVSRAPLGRLLAFRERMGWSFDWVSSSRNSFNFDYRVSFGPDDDPTSYNYGLTKGGADMPGVSVFFKNERGELFHTYSCFSRGIDMLNTAYHYLDLVPKGRAEAGLAHSMSWVKHRDQYGKVA
ncbi:MAG: DUF899 domain-containing protein [Pseudomonadota bacterium]